MENNQEKLEKLDNSIDALISQIEYLATSTDIDLDKRRAGYDPTKDKIRSSTDLIFQLSNSLSSLLAVRHSLSYYDKQSDESNAITAIFGMKKGSDKQ